MLKIPLLYIKDKQVFLKDGGVMRLLGKPLNVAKDLKEKGYKLIHFVDLDALSGLNTNLDVYDGLTYFINVEVECSPKIEIISKLMVLKCRVVIPPTDFELGGLINPNLMVCKIPKNFTGDVKIFKDVILEEFSDSEAKKFSDLGKRIIIYESQKPKIKKLKIWGIILSRF